MVGDNSPSKMYAKAMQGGSDDDSNADDFELPPVSPSYALPAAGPKSDKSDPDFPSHAISFENIPRARGYTDDSAISEANTSSSGSSISKNVLVKMMREQIDLVRSLTNAQIAQKKELERVKEEKRILEEMQKQQREQRDQGTDDDEQQDLKAKYLKQHKKQSSRQEQNQNYKSDKSISTRSFFNLKEKYYPNRIRAFSAETNESAANPDPSMASTIMPDAIVINNATGAATHNVGGAHGYPGQITGPGAYAAYNRDKIEITHVPERDVLKDQDDLKFISMLWRAFSRLCTFLIPDMCLFCGGKTSEQKQAWREKVAIFYIMLFSSAAFIGVSGVIPLFLCRETTQFTMDEIKARDRTEDWTVIFGTIYDISEYKDAHPGGNVIEGAIGKDVSKMFPRRPPGRLPSVCINSAKEVSTRPVCDEFDEVDKLTKLYCHEAVGFSGVDEALGKYERGIFAHRMSNLKHDPHTDWVLIYDRIYNVTKYVNGLRNEQSGEIQEDSENAYLHEDLHGLIINKRGQDATAVYEALYDDDVALSCLDDLFYVGVLDDKENILCQALNIAMYSVMIIIAAVLGIQCLCSLIYLVRMKRTITRDDTRSKVIVMVPCYNEGDKELRKTIDSVMDTSYPDDNKLLLVVADGNIIGKGEKKSTPETLAHILGYRMSPKDRAYKCKSIGELNENRAKLYYGTYKDCGKELKYLVLVKCGLTSEQGSARAGNRGKRDSQLLISGLLNRFHHGRDLNNLDEAIKNALDSLQLPLDEIRYLMAIDADTRIDRESISHMTYSMNKNESILALCGETKVDNKAQSWVTMIQVFEYYTNHHMKKAFESVFGCVTCLPGCFTMYRLFSDDGRPLLSCDEVYQNYATNNVKTLHEKNLYHLGEDRMLTTLLLRNFPDMKLSFVPEATCYTIVPHKFSVLLSQRRRWINSTFHNMLELLRVNTMCGICCLSMKSIVFLDLVATLILPASLIYVGYIVYVTFWMGEPLSLLMLVVWGIVIGVQVVVFLLRSRWDYWWWFFVFVLAGVPVFYFILPIYSFWHMDDFSWGATRLISGKDVSTPKTKSADETIDSRESPKGFEVISYPGGDVIQSTDSGRARNLPVPTPRKSNKSSSQNNTTPIDLDEDVGHANMKMNIHASTPVDVDELTMDDFSCDVSAYTKTTFDPDKYRDAEEAKRIRRLRRAQC
mmetsp:Transcript_24039/g.47974  ORF Transcript_24039/g.47974 Transcript_24039/m.47974 type:complete len:1182 (-) Transcript_24039:184-3729(-)